MYLLCSVRTLRCALPIEHVVETMRPLPVEPLAGTLRWVRGVAVIRGEPIPVVDAAALLGEGSADPTRYVTLRLAERRVALAVDAVLGVGAIPEGTLRELPPLLRDAEPDAVAALAVLDSALTLVLESARLVPDTVWSALEARGDRP